MSLSILTTSRPLSGRAVSPPTPPVGPPSADEWRVLPMRSSAEAAHINSSPATRIAAGLPPLMGAGIGGGEGKQFGRCTWRSEHDADVIYSAIDAGILLRSTDRGYTWKYRAAKDFRSEAMGSVACDPSNSDWVILYGDSSADSSIDQYSGLYHSTNGGSSFTAAQVGVDMCENHLTDKRQEISRAWHNKLVWLPHTPADPAQPWLDRPWLFFLDDDRYDDSPSKPDHPPAIYRSDDGGRTWAKQTAALSSSSSYEGVNRAIYHASSGLVWVCHAGLGVFVYDPDTDTIERVQNGVANTLLGFTPTGLTTSTNITNVELAGNELWVTAFDTGIWHSSDGGQTWTLLTGYPAEYVRACFPHPLNTDRLWLMRAQSVGGVSTSEGVMVSNDGGVTWDDCYPIEYPNWGFGRTYDPINWFLRLNHDFGVVHPDPDDEYAALLFGRTIIWRTDRDPLSANHTGANTTTPGSAFTPSNNLFTGINPSFTEAAIAISPDDPNRIALATSDVFAAYSHDGGASWDRMSSDIGVSWYEVKQIASSMGFDVNSAAIALWQPGSVSAANTNPHGVVVLGSGEGHGHGPALSGDGCQTWSNISIEFDRGTLTAAISSSVTSIPLSTRVDLKKGDHIFIDNEQMEITATPADTGAGNVTVVRARNATSPASHSSGAKIWRSTEFRTRRAAFDPIVPERLWYGGHYSNRDPITTMDRGAGWTAQFNTGGYFLGFSEPVNGDGDRYVYQCEAHFGLSDMNIVRRALIDGITGAVGSWSTHGTLPSGTFGYSNFGFVDPTDPNGDTVYVVGGGTSNNGGHKLYRYDGTTWTEITGIQSALSALGYSNTPFHSVVGRVLGGDLWIAASTWKPGAPQILYTKASTIVASPTAGITGNPDTGWVDASAGSDMPHCGGWAVTWHPHSGELLAGKLCGVWVLPAPHDGSTDLIDSSHAIAYSQV